MAPLSRDWYKMMFRGGQTPLRGASDGTSEAIMLTCVFRKGVSKRNSAERGYPKRFPNDKRERGARTKGAISAAAACLSSASKPLS